MVGDLARRVRYRCFDAPLIAAERARGQQQVRAELDRLSDRPGRAGRARSTPSSPSAEPILGVFGERHHAVMLEVMTRRYYRMRELTDVQVDDRSGRPLLTASYTTTGRAGGARHHRAHRAGRPAAGTDPIAVQGDLRRLIGQLPDGATVLLDLYVARPT